MDLDIDIRKLENCILITVNGEIDLYSVKQLKERITYEIEDHKPPKFVMDLNSVRYIDSTGLGILIGIKRRCAEKGGELLLVFDSERITNLFNITGLHNVFSIYKSVDEASGKFA
jgi:anti-sigma B factor antagonist